MVVLERTGSHDALPLGLPDPAHCCRCCAVAYSRPACGAIDSGCLATCSTTGNRQSAGRRGRARRRARRGCNGDRPAWRHLSGRVWICGCAEPPAPRGRCAVSDCIDDQGGYLRCGDAARRRGPAGPGRSRRHVLARACASNGVRQVRRQNRRLQREAGHPPGDGPSSAHSHIGVGLPLHEPDRPRLQASRR